MLKNISIYSKIIFWFILIIVLLGSITIINNYLISKNIKNVIKIDNPKVINTLEMDIQVKEAEKEVANYILNGIYESEQYNKRVQKFRVHYNNYSKKICSPIEKKILIKIDSLFNEFTVTASQLFKIKREQDTLLNKKIKIFNEEINVIINNKLQNTLKNFIEASSQDEVKEETLYEMQIKLNEILFATNSYLVSTDTFLLKKINENINKFDNLIVSYKKLYLNILEKNSIFDLQKKWNNIKIITFELISFQKNKEKYYNKIQKLEKTIDLILENELQVIAIGNMLKSEKEATSISKTISIIVILLILLVTVLSFFISYSITKPILELIKTTKKIGKGNFNIKTSIKSKDEIGKLAIAFNEMSDNLNISQKELKKEIAERKHAQEIIKQSEEKFRGLAESSSDFIWEINLDGQYKYASPTVETIMGYLPEELLEKNIYDLMLPNEVKLKKSKIKKIIENGANINFLEKKIIHKNGKIVILESSAVPVFNKNGDITGYCGVDKDITERINMINELNNLKKYLSNIIDSMPSIIIGVNDEGKVTQWNKRAEDITGISAKKSKNKKITKIFPYFKFDIKKIKESIKSKKIIREQKQEWSYNNNQKYINFTIYPLMADGMDGAVIRIDDITEIVKMEKIMVQSEKMLSVGGLAAGMAHEINNPLAGMIQTANVLTNRLTGGNRIEANTKIANKFGISIEAIEKYMVERKILPMLKSINESGRRVSNIVNNMLSFSRKNEFIKSKNKIENLIDKTLELASTDYDLKKRYDFKLITIKKHYGEKLPLVNCTGENIQQVLLNIFRNGAQAMQKAGTKNPMLSITTTYDSKTKNLKIAIEDNGPGMEKEIKKRIFEPFFTTKPVGEGTGLGLSVSYFIITENYGGKIIVDSHVDKGSKFTIYLPVLTDSEKTIAKSAETIENLN